MNTEEIRKEIRASIRKRLPLTFYGLYEETFQHLTGIYWYIDRNLLRQQVVFELLENFRKRLTTKEIGKLRKMQQEAEKARQEAKFEHLILADHEV